MSLEVGIMFVAVMFIWMVYALISDDPKKKDYMDDNDTEEKEPKKKEGKKNV